MENIQLCFCEFFVVGFRILIFMCIYLDVGIFVYKYIWIQREYLNTEEDIYGFVRIINFFKFEIQENDEILKLYEVLRQMILRTFKIFIEFVLLKNYLFFYQVNFELISGYIFVFI